MDGEGEDAADPVLFFDTAGVEDDDINDFGDGNDELDAAAPAAAAGAPSSSSSVSQPQPQPPAPQARPSPVRTSLPASLPATTSRAQPGRPAAGPLPPQCYVQRLAVHPEDAGMFVPWVLASLVVRAGNALSDDRESDLAQSPPTVAEVAKVLSWYFVWVCAVWVALTWLFLLTDGGAGWCEVGMTVPKWLRQTADMMTPVAGPGSDDGGGGGGGGPYVALARQGFWAAGLPLWYLARFVRDELHPRVLAWSRGLTPRFLSVFLATALAASLLSADTWWWAGATLLLPSSLVEGYTRSQELKSGVLDIAQSPVEALQAAVSRVFTPASMQYGRMLLLAIVLGALWLFLLLPLLVQTVFAASVLGIPLFSRRSTTATVRAIWTHDGGKVAKTVAAMTAGACLWGIRETVRTVRNHPPALALMLGGQGAVCVAICAYLLARMD